LCVTGTLKEKGEEVMNDERGDNDDDELARSEVKSQGVGEFGLV